MAACRSAGKAWFKRPASHHHGAAKKFWPVKLSLRFQIPNSSLRSPDLQSYSTRRKFLPYAHARSGGMHAHGQLEELAGCWLAGWLLYRLAGWALIMSLPGGRPDGELAA
jgi:hypothetical protein